MFLLRPATLVVMLAVAVMVTVGLLLLGRSRRTDGGESGRGAFRVCRTPGCGHMNRAGAQYCGLCGKPLDGTPPVGGQIDGGSDE